MGGRSWWNHQDENGTATGIELKMMDDGFKIPSVDVRFTHASFAFSNCGTACHACYNACAEGNGTCYSACDDGACGYVCSPENPTVNE